MFERPILTERPGLSDRTDDVAPETSLGRGFTLLAHLADAADANETLGVSELARRTGYAKSTVHRLLSTLCRVGAVERRNDERYQIGLRLFELGNRAQLRESLRAHALRALHELRDATGETAHLGVLAEDSVIYIEKVETANTVRMASEVGHRNPLYCTALGKTLLAFGDPDGRERALAAAPFPARTTATLVDAAALGRDFERIRARGYAIDDEESELGLRCIAAPVREAAGTTVAAISISGPTTRVTAAAVPRLGGEVVRSAAMISASLGYRGGSRR